MRILWGPWSCMWCALGVFVSAVSVYLLVAAATIGAYCIESASSSSSTSVPKGQHPPVPPPPSLPPSLRIVSEGAVQEDAAGPTCQRADGCCSTTIGDFRLPAHCSLRAGFEVHQCNVCGSNDASACDSGLPARLASQPPLQACQYPLDASRLLFDMESAVLEQLMGYGEGHIETGGLTMQQSNLDVEGTLEVEYDGSLNASLPIQILPVTFNMSVPMPSHVLASHTRLASRAGRLHVLGTGMTLAGRTSAEGGISASGELPLSFQGKHMQSVAMPPLVAAVATNLDGKLDVSSINVSIGRILFHFSRDGVFNLSVSDVAVQIDASIDALAVTGTNFDVRSSFVDGATASTLFPLNASALLERAIGSSDVVSNLMQPTVRRLESDMVDVLSSRFEQVSLNLAPLLQLKGSAEVSPITITCPPITGELTFADTTYEARLGVADASIYEASVSPACCGASGVTITAPGIVLPIEGSVQGKASLVGVPMGPTEFAPSFTSQVTINMTINLSEDFTSEGQNLMLPKANVSIAIADVASTLSDFDFMGIKSSAFLSPITLAELGNAISMNIVSAATTRMRAIEQLAEESLVAAAKFTVPSPIVHRATLADEQLPPLPTFSVSAATKLTRLDYNAWVPFGDQAARAALSTIPLAVSATPARFRADAQFKVPVKGSIGFDQSNFTAHFSHPNFGSYSVTQNFAVNAVIDGELLLTASAAVGVSNFAVSLSGSALGTRLQNPNVSVSVSLANATLTRATASILSANGIDVTTMFAEYLGPLHLAIGDVGRFVNSDVALYISKAQEEIIRAGSVDNLGLCSLHVLCQLTWGCDNEAVLVFGHRVRSYACAVIGLASLAVVSLTLMIARCLFLCIRRRCGQRSNGRKATQSGVTEFTIDATADTVHHYPRNSPIADGYNRVTVRWLEDSPQADLERYSDTLSVRSEASSSEARGTASPEYRNVLPGRSDASLPDLHKTTSVGRSSPESQKKTSPERYVEFIRPDSSPEGSTSNILKSPKGSTPAGPTEWVITRV